MTLELPEGTQEVKLGVLELHYRDGLRSDFYAVLEDCQAAAAIVDVFLMDLQEIFHRHGYDLRVFRLRADAGRGEPTIKPRG